MNELGRIETLAQQIGFCHSAPMNMAVLQAHDEIRALCSQNTCRAYGTTWACPPACGSVDHWRSVFADCFAGFLVQTTAHLADDFDSDAIAQAERLHKARFDTLARQARMIFPGQAVPLGAGGCRQCARCTYPSRPCRYPHRLIVSMEACGLLVSEVCEQAGLPYYYGPRTLTYTSCILLRKKA